MDTAARTLLAGIKHSPIPTCSCAKGLAVGLTMIQSSWGVLAQLPDVLTGRAPPSVMDGPATSSSGSAAGGAGADGKGGLALDIASHPVLKRWVGSEVREAAAAGSTRTHVARSGSSSSSNSSSSGSSGWEPPAPAPVRAAPLSMQQLEAASLGLAAAHEQHHLHRLMLLQHE